MKKQGLKKWEIEIIKAMLESGEFNDQEILAYFTRPGRTVNHARILEIRTGQKYSKIQAVSNRELRKFIKYRQI